MCSVYNKTVNGPVADIFYGCSLLPETQAHTPVHTHAQTYKATSVVNILRELYVDITF